jgi:hypothetical protein
VAAIGADTVRQHRLIAVAAILDLERFDVMVAPPFALPGVRSASLWNCHEFESYLNQFMG